MKIAIVSQYFETPDDPGISLLSSMAEHFAREGHDVTVICGRFIRMGRRKAQRLEKTPSGYTVRRTWSGSDRSRNIVSRIISFAAFSISSVAALVRLGRCDVIYASSPPIFPVLPALLWARLSGAKFIAEICDLWPESVVALGVIRAPTVIALASSLERFLYRHSDGIVALTRGIAGTISERHHPRAPLLVARGAISPELYALSHGRRSDIRSARDWDGKCIAIFAGTIGYAQDIDTLLEAASLLSDHEDLRIVLVGDGVFGHRARAAAERLPNLDVLPPLPKAQMVPLLIAADIGLCTLSNVPLFAGAVPSKLLDYLAAGLAVVAPDFDEVSGIVTGQNAGKLYRAGNAQSLARAVCEAAEALRPQSAGAEKPVSVLPAEFTQSHRNEKIGRFISGGLSAGC